MNSDIQDVNLELYTKKNFTFDNEIVVLKSEGVYPQRISMPNHSRHPFVPHKFFC